MNYIKSIILPIVKCLAFLALLVTPFGVLQAQTYDYLPGDINMIYGIWPPAVIGSDVTFLVNHFRGIPGCDPCFLDGFWASADINGDCTIIGSDVTRLVGYFRSIVLLSYCNDYPATWPSPDYLPELPPAGWPNCQQPEDHPPVLAIIGAQAINEGDTLTIRIAANDPDNDPIALLAEQLPANAGFVDSSGGIGGFVFAPDYDQAGVYQVRLIARSTNLADTEMVPITVANTNRFPVLEEIGPKFVVIDNELQFQTSATDPDGAIPSMTAAGLPAEASYVDNGDGTGDFSWLPGADDIGAHDIWFRASDGELVDSELVTITVRESALQGLIADHTFCTMWPGIPTLMINDILANQRIYYMRTSHGSQIESGLTLVNEEDSRFPDLNYYPYQIIYDEGGDLGGYGDTSWAAPARAYIDSHPECTVVMFSWCSGVTDNTEEGINIYLNKMTELENQYPDVDFVYMTGHLDETGPDGNLYQRNNQIRQYCVANNKILFDFADIESWDPEGNYYPWDTDACLWCSDWCADPQNDCPEDCYCAHSHCLNCLLKAKAFWAMMAFLEGWAGN